MQTLRQKYGPTALVAGASEGIGAAYAKALAANGFELVLVARRKKPLEEFGRFLTDKYRVNVQCISCDLSRPTAAIEIEQQLNGKEINLLVYNAALSYIGHFLENSEENHLQMAQVNMLTPLNMLHVFGSKMVTQGRGGIILMASLAGFQGSGFLAMYAATKAFNRTMAESLWFEWKASGVDVMACCAGATSTPNFKNSRPEKTSIFAPKVQTPDEVVAESLRKLGKKPSFIAGTGNKVASFFMQKVLPRKMTINIMGSNTRTMYRI
jgi:short-subunit dehydrogenase